MTRRVRSEQAFAASMPSNEAISGSCIDASVVRRPPRCRIVTSSVQTFPAMLFAAATMASRGSRGFHSSSRRALSFEIFLA